jgi:kynurenine formamidase
MAASLGLAVVENLVNLRALEGREAFFIFAPAKIAGTRGGHGRAIALVGDRLPASDP